MSQHHDFGGDAVKQLTEKFVRRDGAATYLQQNYGFGTVRSLAKMATQGGGPPYRKYGARVCLYSLVELDKWAQAKMSAPQTSTSGGDANADRPQGCTSSRPHGRGKARDRRAIV